VSPTTPAEIAAFAAARTLAVPTALDTLWRTIGAASWRLGERGARLLAPLEVLARRPVARAAGEAYLAKLAPTAAEQAAPVARSLDVIVESLDGRPLTLVADVARDDGRVFAHATEHFQDFWWESSLGSMLATGLLSDLEDAIATAEPSVERLRYGQLATPVKPEPGRAKKPAKRKATPTKPAKPQRKAATPKPKPKVKPTRKARVNAKPKPKATSKTKAKPKPKPKRRS
jgi:hypothetical protein